MTNEKKVFTLGFPKGYDLVFFIIYFVFIVVFDIVMIVIPIVTHVSNFAIYTILVASMNIVAPLLMFTYIVKEIAPDDSSSV